MADKKKQLTDKLADVYAQDPETRLRALEQTEPIKDVTAPLAANIGQMMIPGSEPLWRGIAGFNSLARLNQDRLQGNTFGGWANHIQGAVAPYMPHLWQAIANRFPALQGRL